MGTERFTGEVHGKTRAEVHARAADAVEEYAGADVVCWVVAVDVERVETCGGQLLHYRATVDARPPTPRELRVQMDQDRLLGGADR